MILMEMGPLTIKSSQILSLTDQLLLKLQVAPGPKQVVQIWGVVPLKEETQQ
jgi:hypothetical protein